VFRRANLPFLLVAVVIVLNAWALAAELSNGRFDLNDSIFHYTMADRMVQAVERGENPLDSWVSEWTFGYPVSRTYQPLGHLIVAAVHLISAKTISVFTVFVWFRYLLIVLLPLTVYVSGRWLQLDSRTAAAAAMLSPLISTNGLFGIEYGSYLWRGNGLFTQAVAMHLMLLAIGLAFKGIRVSGKYVLASMVLGLTFLAHFAYGYMGALSVCLFAAIPGAATLPKRLFRLAATGVAAFSVSAFVLLPALMDSAWVNHSRWEPAWKWDSFGGAAVLKAAVTGGLMDYGRLPVLSLLSLLGAVVCFARARAKGSKDSHLTVLLTVSVFWVVLFFGKPTRGVLYSLIGPADLQLHRFSGAVHMFLLFLAGIGLVRIWDFTAGRRVPFGAALAGLATLILIAPAVAERWEFLAKNKEWGAANLAAWRAEESSVETVLTKLKDSPGRVYPGLAAGWGKNFRVGDVPLYGILSTHHIPAVGFLYHAMALTSDVMVLFDERVPAQYRLFNISTVLSDAAWKWKPAASSSSEQVGRFQIAKIAGGGYFDVVHVPFAVVANKQNAYDTSSVWLKSEWVGKQAHILLDFRDDAPPKMPRLTLGQPLPRMGNISPPGSVQHEANQSQTYEADLDVREPAYVLFKMTYHPNWHAYVDGALQSTSVLTPGFIGVPVTAGPHHIRMRYEPTGFKNLLLVIAGLSTGLLLIVRRTAVLDRLEQGVTSKLDRLIAAPGFGYSPIVAAAGIVLLSLPVCLPLFTAGLPSGHDTYTYHPRLVEFHENVAHGILLPRWAPDLESGAGQPLFLFTPPVLFYVAELWRLLGATFVTALNLAAIVIVLASALAMFLLGDFYFGRKAAWLGAAAYVYAPYFLVDLYVRHALAEFAAFPFYPLTLYGFGRYARDGDARFLFLGSASYAGLVMSHNQSALLFSPVLLAFIGFLAWNKRSIHLLARLGGGIICAFGLSACVWLPILAEMRFVHIERSIQGYLNYAGHFVYLPQFLSPTWGYGQSAAGPRDGMSFSLGWGHVVLLLAAATMLSKTKHGENRRLLRFWVGTLAVLIALMTSASVWFWDNLPLLKQVQFPWRLLAPASLCVALLVSMFGLALQSKIRNQTLWFWIAMGLIVLPNLSHIGPERYFQIDSRQWSPRYLAQSGFETTTSYEFEPRWVKNRSGYAADKIHVITGQASISAPVYSPTRWSAEIDAASDSYLGAALLYFPGWTVSVDEHEIAGETLDNGRIGFHVPAGRHQVSLELKRTRVRFLAELMSLGFLIALVILGKRMRRRKS
jgi:uncharacterized membrane protein